ncbi:rap guanine nucleotide exchange factor 5-like isoform X2 [Cyclopterus lumpus]|uniref:rap guanine nucleotide exchange factor 5-like isoform X2 n=1 Tax=Cyclopterus lumpus TaxID=8103 RepID=UPI0014873A74|nr:rap guanine nucleotide exchange factor 5-like isoform X2 [Cyclopterus lumpus]XP_034409595.1 rap guanine nucleotide exchange factor 5-like isoform X2 [Cyclopterus lumpus]
MGSQPQPLNLLQEEGRLLHAALVEQEEDEEEGSVDSSSDSTSRAEPVTMPTFDVPYFRYIDDEGTEGEEEWSSSRSMSSIEEDSSTDSVVSDRYVVVSGTPEKILEHLLSDLTLDEDQGTTPNKESDILLDDVLLTYPVFMSTSDLCQALLGHYCTKRYRGKEALERKRKVLHLVSQWMALCKDFLREDEHVKLFMKTLYRYVLDDLNEHPMLEKDVRELKKLYQLHRRHVLDEYSPQRKGKALVRQLSLKENGLQSRSTQREAKEVLCHVYITMDSFLSMRARTGIVAQELLQALAERMEVPLGKLVLVAVTYNGGRLLLRPQDRVFSDSLRPVGRLHVCRKDLGEVLNPLTDNTEMQQGAVRMLSLNTWDVAVALTNFDWTIFESIHEQELVYFTFSRHSSSSHTVALELLLQRCNEVQLWVMTEVLLCPTLCKRVQLIKKFIKIAAHCKAQRNLNCFFAIIMGLNTAAVSRLGQTWEKIPGKFKRLFSELETVTDPSLNHKAYRDSFKKMKAPKIPFPPLLLKDITFIHEGNKTFHDNLVNFEKLHMIADTVRLIRQCQKDHMGNGITQKSSSEARAYIDYLHIIDNQQTLFELSHGLEPRA